MYNLATPMYCVCHNGLENPLIAKVLSCSLLEGIVVLSLYVNDVLGPNVLQFLMAIIMRVVYLHSTRQLKKTLLPFTLSGLFNSSLVIFNEVAKNSDSRGYIYISYVSTCLHFHCVNDIEYNQCAAWMCVQETSSKSVYIHSCGD